MTHVMNLQRGICAAAWIEFPEMPDWRRAAFYQLVRINKLEK